MTRITPTQGVSEPTLRRLPWYLAYVTMLNADGEQYVSSTAIGRAINVDSSQTAKDLSVLGLRGKTRIGYRVDELEATLRRFLGFTQPHRAVIMGAGSLGGALMADTGLDRYGLKIVAGFDNNPARTGTSHSGVPVYHTDDLESRCRTLRAEIGIICVPVDQAQITADALVAAGVKALWNFTPFRIRTASDIVIQNTSIYAHLAVMYNRLATAPQQ